MVVRTYAVDGKQSREHKLVLCAAMATPAAAAAAQCSIDYYLVLDFEATCENGRKMKPQEIIEFPVLKLNASTHEVESTFHSYVQPTVHTALTPFCTELTGITQDMVDGQPVLADVMKQFHKWMSDNGLLEPDVSSCFVTCGDWDLKSMLPRQCSYFKIPIPAYFRRWVNIKRVYEEVTGQPAKGMAAMLRGLGLRLDGRHHSGIDDSKNIAKILVKLLSTRPNISPTIELPPFRL